MFSRTRLKLLIDRWKGTRRRDRQKEEKDTCNIYVDTLIMKMQKKSERVMDM